MAFTVHRSVCSIKSTIFHTNAFFNELKAQDILGTFSTKRVYVKLITVLTRNLP